MVRGARAAAIEKGEKTYTTGRSCKYGHVAVRRTATGKCLECERINQSTDKQRDYHRRLKQTPKYREMAETYRKSVQHTTKYKEQARKNHLKRMYGLTPEEYNTMLEQQGGNCAICYDTLTDKCGVDHCHISGVVRGILCFSCNKMLGMARDSVDTLSNAIAYLTNNRG